MQGLAPTESSVDASINWRETIVKESDHVFTKRAKDWGFREFMPLEKLRDPQASARARLLIPARAFSCPRASFNAFAYLLKPSRTF